MSDLERDPFDAANGQVAQFEISAPKRSARLHLMSMLRSSLARNSSWNLIGSICNQGSTFALGVVLSRELGRESYGSFALLQGTLLTFANLAQLALGFSTTKFVAEYRATQPARAARIVGVSLALSTVTGFVATLLAASGSHLLSVRAAHQPGLESMILYASPTIFFSVVTGILTATLAGFEQFRTIAMTSVVAGIAYLGLGAAGAAGWQLRGVVVALPLSAAIQSVIVFAAMKHEAGRIGISVTMRGVQAMKEESEVLLHTTVPSSLSGLSTIITLWLVMTILARQSDGITQLALFAAANSLRLLVGFMPALINTVGFSILSTRKGEGDVRGYRRAFQANLIAVIGTALCGVAIVALAGPLALRLFGRSFDGGYPVLLILLVATIPEAASISIVQVVQTHGSQWWTFFYIALPRNVVWIASALVLAPRYGAIGLAVAYLLALSAAFGGVLLLYPRARQEAMGERSL